MPNPLAPIASILDHLADEIRILPAVGGATEDYLRPDQEEVEDALINREADEVTAFAECPTPSPTELYVSTPPIPRTRRHLFRFFIDGSLLTYHLGTGIEGDRSFPIQLAQIGAALTERRDNGTIKVLKVLHRILLLVPRGGRGLSDTVWSQMERAVSPNAHFELVDVVAPDVVSGETRDQTDLRNKAGGKARYEMHKLEIRLIEETNGLRDDEHWLILDGAVKLDEFIEVPHLIGVAKSFRKNPMFYFGRKRRRATDVTSILAGLPHENRTVAFSSHQQKVAFWYVRLREQRQLDYPLMGVVKVELPRPDRGPVDTELANQLSSALAAERNVTPYGADRRWHCHLYPIFLTEQAIKNGFYSRDVLLGAFRWPHRPFAQ